MTCHVGNLGEAVLADPGSRVAVVRAIAVVDALSWRAIIVAGKRVAAHHLRRPIGVGQRERHSYLRECKP